MEVQGRMNFKLFAVVILCLYSCFAKAEMDGNRLLSFCKEAIKFMDSERAISLPVASCLMKLGGIREMNYMYMQYLNKTKPLFCPPDSIDNGKFVRIAVSYLEANPSSLHYSDTSLMVLAFREAFPCDG